jgi:hypothetical protein
MARTTTRNLCIVATIVLSLMPNGRALAQPAPGPQADPRACSDDQRLRLDGQNAPRDPSGQDLSDKLARTDGVICPPNVDAAIKAPTPDVGQMPIIPPPGSPGGDPTVRPK